MATPPSRTTRNPRVLAALLVGPSSKGEASASPFFLLNANSSAQGPPAPRPPRSLLRLRRSGPRLRSALDEVVHDPLRSDDPGHDGDALRLLPGAGRGQPHVRRALEALAPPGTGLRDPRDRRRAGSAAGPSDPRSLPPGVPGPLPAPLPLPGGLCPREAAPRPGRDRHSRPSAWAVRCRRSARRSRLPAARLGIPVGGLYAINLLGATLGTLAVPFVLLPRLGLAASYACAVAGSLGVGLTAYLIGSATPQRPAPESAPPLRLGRVAQRRPSRESSSCSRACPDSARSRSRCCGRACSPSSTRTRCIRSPSWCSSSCWVSPEARPSREGRWARGVRLGAC